MKLSEKAIVIAILCLIACSFTVESSFENNDFTLLITFAILGVASLVIGIIGEES